MNSAFSDFRLVDYSSDEATDEEETLASHTYPCAASPHYPNILKETQKCEALPLPNEIKQMFKEYPDESIDEDPTRHCGKIRSFPHERGVWATYIYIEYNAEKDFFAMIEKFQELAASHGINLNVPEDFHVSLSRTLQLRHHWITPFIDALKVQLSCFYRFRLVFQSLEVYENEEKTRTFLGMKVHIGFEQLLKMVKKVDACLAEFKLPSFYKNPSFHLSFASCVGSHAKNIESFLADLNVIFHSFIDSHADCRTLWVSKINCKSGNKLFTVNLKT